MTELPRTFSPARVARGPLLFVSGQVPMDVEGRVPEGIVDQTRLVLANIEGQLAAHDAGWDAVVKVTYFLRDLADLAPFREVLLSVLPQPRPAASLVEVSGLIDARFRVEIEAVAELGHGPS
jgi:2-iminobutanoate/2-iminopropanoate deaminase